MRRRVLFVLVVCLAVLVTLGIGVSAASADPVWPGVSTAHIAHVNASDGHWWTGGAGWGDGTIYPAGTPIPAEKSIVLYEVAVLPLKADLEGISEGLLLSVTVTAPDGSVVVATTEAQSPQSWSRIQWWPAVGWSRWWEVYVGQLPAGDYKVTLVVHQPETVVISDYDENGDLVPTVIKKFKKTVRSSFTVQ